MTPADDTFSVMQAAPYKSNWRQSSWRE